MSPLCSGNISRDFSVTNMKKTGLFGYVYHFSVYYDSDDVEKEQNKIMFGVNCFPANICWSPRGLEGIFSVTILCLTRRFQGVFKIFSRRLAKTL